MSDDDAGFDLQSALDSGAQAVESVRAFLGVEREAHVCPHCEVVCVEAHTFDPDRAAFDGGQSPCWRCPECDREYVRETSDESHTIDLYGRDSP